MRKAACEGELKDDYDLQELASKGRIWDHRRDQPVTPVRGRVPHYAIAKYALLRLVTGHIPKGDTEQGKPGREKKSRENH